MADKQVPSPDDTGAVRKFVDMGDGTFAERVVSVSGAPAAGAAGYPAGATPLVASSGVVANATATATLPAAVGKTTYISGIQVSGFGATAAGVAGCTISGLVGGVAMQLLVAVPAGNTLAITTHNVTFNPPIPAAAPNTAIVATMNALGAGSNQAIVNIQGFQL